MNEGDHKFIEYARELAVNNPDIISPKSMSVGCVIVKNDYIVGQGYRWTKVLQQEPYKDITYHAEHCAIMNAGNKCKGATLYTTLEPCTHRIQYPHPTPRCCCELIKQAGISRVVYLVKDEGLGTGGEEYLKSEGIEVD